MSDPLEPEELLQRVYALAKANKQSELIALVMSEWQAMRERTATTEDAETCRQTMLASYKLGQYRPGYVWRMRAMVRAAAAGWVDGVVALLQTEALRIQAVINDNKLPSDPGYVVAPEALEILEEFEPYVGLDAGTGIAQPSPRFSGRTYHEKYAFLLFADRRYNEALSSYREALRYTEGDERGWLKVRGGIANARYMSSDDPTVKHQALQETLGVAADSRRLGHAEIEAIAREHADRMRAARKDLTGYETL